MLNILDGIPTFVGSATLTFRPGERFFIMDFVPDQDACYAVMLLETPAFPGKQHEESHNLSVLAAAKYPTTNGKSGDEPRWGWIQLDGETKDMIGNMLIEIKALPGQWYYMLIEGGIGHRSMEHILKLTGD